MEIDEILDRSSDIANKVNESIKTGNCANLGQDVKDISKTKMDSPYMFPKEISGSWSTTQIILGILGVCLFGIILLAASIANIFFSISLTVILILAVLLALSVALFVRGLQKSRLAGRCKRIAKMIGGRTYIELAKLEQSMPVEHQKLVKDLRSMIRFGAIPNGKLIADDTTLTLTQEAYQEYVNYENAQEQQKELAADEQRKTGQLPEAVRTILQDVENHREQIRNCEKEISDPAMKEKAAHLDDVTGRITAKVKESPECIGKLHKFTSYYLPTTEKLLRSYCDLEHQPDAGDNITTTKGEIETSFDMINDAFENLLDSLFQDSAWDIKSDISVMKTMMAQEGLTNQRGVAQETVTDTKDTKQS